jgi:hypothetical protein
VGLSVSHLLDPALPGHGDPQHLTKRVNYNISDGIRNCLRALVIPMAIPVLAGTSQV